MNIQPQRVRELQADGSYLACDVWPLAGTVPFYDGDAVSWAPTDGRVQRSVTTLTGKLVKFQAHRFNYVISDPITHERVMQSVHVYIARGVNPKTAAARLAGVDLRPR